MSSHYVRPADFEDMMRPIAKAAFDQGWQLRWTANGHVKWIPPKGPCVITSVTNAAYKPNIVKLREGGLVIPNDQAYKEEKHEDQGSTGPIVEPKPVEQPTKEKKRMLPRGSVQNAVMEFFKGHPDPTITHSLDDVVTHVRGVLPGVSREVISTTCSQSAASGKLVRMGKGMYRVANQDRRAADKEELTPDEQRMLAEDEKIMDNFLNALAELQAWAERQRKLSIQLNRLKRMLEGTKLQ